MSTTAAVSFRSFSFQYYAQKHPTLHDINLDVHYGEKIVIVGPSGSGKSTLGSCLNGLIPFSYEGNIEGALVINGVLSSITPIAERSKVIGTVLQDTDGQFVGLNVGEDVAFSLENDCVPLQPMRRMVHDASVQVGLADYLLHSPQKISGGQKQRAALAGILVDEVDILLFDEPLANLDPHTGMRAIEIIDDLHTKQHKTIIIIEHRLEDVLHRSVDRIVLIDEGRIVADAPPDDVIRSGLLREHGLREPLFVSLFRYAKVDLGAATAEQTAHTAHDHSDAATAAQTAHAARDHSDAATAAQTAHAARDHSDAATAAQTAHAAHDHYDARVDSDAATAAQTAHAAHTVRDHYDARVDLDAATAAQTAHAARDHYDARVDSDAATAAHTVHTAHTAHDHSDAATAAQTAHAARDHYDARVDSDAATAAQTAHTVRDHSDAATAVQTAHTVHTAHTAHDHSGAATAAQTAHTARDHYDARVDSGAATTVQTAHTVHTAHTAHDHSDAATAAQTAHAARDHYDARVDLDAATAAQTAHTAHTAHTARDHDDARVDLGTTTAAQTAHAASLSLSSLSPLNTVQKQQIRTWFKQHPAPPHRHAHKKALQLDGVSFAYQGHKEVLQNISFTIFEGEMIAIVGSNGAGKSTIAKLVCGFEPLTHGNIYIEEKNVQEDSIQERTGKVGYVMQNPNHMITKQIVFDEVALGLELGGVDAADITARVHAVLGVCGLRKYAHYPISALSYGQKKRVTIAAILILNPHIIILDEPTAGQDHKHYSDVMEFLRTLNQELGLTIVLITHDMHLMLEYTQRAIVLSDGHLLADVPTAQALTDVALNRRANLKETSLYYIATQVGIQPDALVQRFVATERQAITQRTAPSTATRPTFLHAEHDT